MKSHSPDETSSNTTAAELNPKKLCKTIHSLEVIVAEKFPERSFRKTILELSKVAKEAKELSYKLSGKHVVAWTIIIAAPIVLLCAISYLFIVYAHFSSDEAQTGILEYSDTLDLFVNLIVLSVMGSYALFRQYRLRRRKRAMQILHKLRSIAHVIDLTQHGKNYQFIVDTQDHKSDKYISLDDCIQYLTYSSQALSLTSKVAAILIEDYNDNTVIASVCEIESLCTGISLKIWQKIETLQRHVK